MSAVISGPTAVAPEAVHPYTVIVTGGPAVEGGTFEISYTLEGEDLAGGDPQIPRTLSNAEGTFEVNVTAPRAEGRVHLFVRATSRNETVNATAETRLAIDVFRPVDLRAVLRNSGGATVVNVSVLFYVDGELVGNETVPRIEPGGQVEVTMMYIPVGLTLGRHTVRIEADLDGDGVISPERGELIDSEFFYKTERTNLPAILGFVTVFILALLALVLLAIRRQRRRG